MKDIIVAMVAVIPPLITALPILFKLLFQPLQTQRPVSVDVATTTLHKVVKVSRESIKHNDSERDYFLRFIRRIQMWTILSFGLLFISLLIFLLSNALAEAFRGDKLAILFSLSILMLLVIYILWPIYIHRLEEDIESKFHFFKKISVLYEQNYHDITYNILAALKLLNIPLYDLDKRENMLTNFIEFEIHEEAFTVTVKEVDPNHTILEITLIEDETIEQFNEKKNDSNNRSIGQAQTVDKSQAPSTKSRINGIDLLTNLPLIYLYRRIELVNQIRRRAFLINQFVSIVLVDLTQENSSGKTPSDHSG